jgi:hypothetical protein
MEAIMVIDYAIEILSGEKAGQRLQMHRRRITLGRHPQHNDVVLAESTISSRHASITYDLGQYLLEDLGSTNKTFINGRALEAGETVALHDGMSFRLGKVHLCFREDLPAGTQTVAAKAGRQGEGGRQKTGVPPATADRQRFANALLERVKGIFKGRLPVDGRRRWVTAGGLLVALLFCLSMVKWLLGTGPATTSQSKAPAPDHSLVPIPLPAEGVYGFTRKRDQSHPDKAIFEFETDTRRAVLVYTPGGIDDAGEVQISFNGEVLGRAAVAEGWGAEQALSLPRQLIAKGGVNRVTFDHLRNPPAQETWAVRNVSVRLLPEIACNTEEGERLLALGNERFSEKAVDTGNLFQAVTYFKKATEMGEACTPPPGFLKEAEAQLQRSRAELDVTYNNLVFAYKKALKLKDYRQTQRHLEAITRLIVDTQDVRHKKAQRLLTRLNQALANSK